MDGITREGEPICAMRGFFFLGEKVVRLRLVSRANIDAALVAFPFERVDDRFLFGDLKTQLVVDAFEFFVHQLGVNPPT